MSNFGWKYLQQGGILSNIGGVATPSFLWFCNYFKSQPPCPPSSTVIRNMKYQYFPSAMHDDGNDDGRWWKVFENAAQLIIYSGHLFKLWELNSIQQLLTQLSVTMMAMAVTTMMMMDQLNSRAKLTQNDMLPGLKVSHCPSSWQHCWPDSSLTEREEDIRWTVQKVPPLHWCTALIEKNPANFQRNSQHQKSLENINSYCQTLPSNLIKADCLYYRWPRPNQTSPGSLGVHQKFI